MKHSYGSSNKNLKMCFLEWGKLGGEKQINKGLYVDLVSRVFKHAGYNLTVDFIIWKDCVKGAENLKYDVIPIIWEGKNFDDRFDYLNRIAIDSINFISLEGNNIKNGFVSSLKGKRIGWVTAYGGMEDFHRIKNNFIPIEFSTGEAQIKALVNGEVDAIITDPAPVINQISRLAPEMKTKLRVLEPALKKNFSSPGVSKKNLRKKSIINDFDKSFKELVRMGLYDDLNKVHKIKIKRED
jgi:hypothetical protein